MTMSETFIEASERITALVKQSKWFEAEHELSLLPRDHKAWRRMHGHLRAKISLIKGDYLIACRQMQDLVNEEGPYILILADIVACYFMAKQYTKWQLAIAEFKNEFIKCKWQLHTTTKCRAEIILAKSLELNGSIAESYNIFLDLSRVSNLDFRLKGLNNLVRLEAQYPLSVDFSFHYSQLKLFNFNSEQLDYNYDVVHSLLLAEAEHIDMELAMKNLAKIPRTETCFFALGYFELLDIYLRIDSSAYIKIEAQFGPCEPFTLADSFLLQLAEGKEINDWYNWANLIPVAQYFRLLVFLIPNLTTKDRDLCLTQVELLLKSLSPESRIVWLNLFKKDKLFAPRPTTLKFDSNGSDSISINNKTIDFGRQKLVFQLLQLLVAHNGSLSFDEISTKIWNCNIDTCSLDRIRQLVRRANFNVKKVAHVNILNIRNNKVELSSEIHQV